MTESVNNRTFIPLQAGRVFIGTYDTVIPFSTAVVSCLSDTECVISAFQSQNKVQTSQQTFNVQAGVRFTTQIQISNPYLYFTVRNSSGAINGTQLSFTVIYHETQIVSSSFGVNSNIFDSNGDPIVSSGGNLQVQVMNFPATQGVTGTVDIGNFPATQGVTGTVDIGNFPELQGVTGTVAVSSLPDLTGLVVDIEGQAVALVPGTIPHLNYATDSILDSGVYKPTDDGENSYFEITASPVNNVVLYYADETKGTDAMGGGWQFASTASGTKNTKINWYMYQPKTDVVVGDLTSINAMNTYYTIITNVGVEFPLIYIYTKPTVPATKITGALGGSAWYQSKFVYQATQAGTNTGQQCLLYVGKDPTDIRNDIPHIKLSQLDSLCQGTLQTNEIVMSASLQTSSDPVSPPNNFSLTMFKFGVIIAPVNTPLKVDANGALNVVISNPAVNSRGGQTLWATTSTGAGGFSASADLANKAVLNLTFYGNSNTATVFTVQFSNNGTTWYSSDYTHTLVTAGDWGFSITASPFYVRLTSSVNVSCNAILNYS
jgi:hypothetical protein